MFCYSSVGLVCVGNSIIYAVLIEYLLATLLLDVQKHRRMNSVAADQYGPVPSGKYCIVSVSEPTCCFFKGLTHRSMLRNYVCIHTDVGTLLTTHLMHMHTRMCRHLKSEIIPEPSEGLMAP